MSQAVIIKSSKCGINLVLDAALPFPVLLEEILNRFKESEKFFANSSFAISFEGRELAEEEKYQIIDAIMQETSIKILCIMEEDEIRDAVVKLKIKEQQEAQEKAAGQRKENGAFYYGSLAQGEHLETDESIVIIGDVPYGASVVSQSDIVILGTLKGSAYAGMSGRQESFISALEFDPESYNISGIYGDPLPKEKASLFSKRNKTPQAMIATVREGIINVSPLN